MSRTFRIAPSLLSADFAQLGAQAKQAVAAGADLISVHPDASAHVDRTLQVIRAAGCQVGLVCNPAALRKVEKLRRLIDDHHRETGRDIRLAVGGGIKTDNIRAVANALRRQLAA
jgi:ribulose-phosphate 3-epimerase